MAEVAVRVPEIAICIIITVSSAFHVFASNPEVGMTNLRMLSVEIYDSVCRISDGLSPDESDARYLRLAATTLRGEAELIEFVNTDVQGPPPPHPKLSGEYWIDPLWLAVRQLDMVDALGGDPLACLTQFAADLEKVAQGNRDVAKDSEPLVQRLATLVEMSGAH